MESRPLVDPVRFAALDSGGLRAAFVVDDLFAPDEVRLVHWEGERTIIGSAVPRARTLRLEAPPEVGASFFAERREMGIVNVGSAGAVAVDGKRHALGPRDALYVGRGAKEVVFESAREAEPARFYLVSHPAHASHPTRRVTREEAQTQTIGTAAGASVRTLRRYIHPASLPTCQVVLGVTDLETGSIWNTMPPHTHARRTEIYLYFDLDPDAVAFHFLGPPEATRHVVLRNLQAVLSPSWSMHFGAGTRRYAFVWSMGGENQDFEDMQAVAVDRLR